MNEIDWTAPIEPGRGMLGLKLGMSEACARAALGEGGEVVEFRNSPKLRLDYRDAGVALLRVADIGGVLYEWQDIAAGLIFEDGFLTRIFVQSDPSIKAFLYRGKIFDAVALAGLVVDLLNFGSFEYDDVEEVFFSDQWHGVEIGGMGACDLTVDPEQRVTFIKVFRSER